MHLRAKDFSKAADILKTFEKKESGLLSTAASNLSFLFFLVRAGVATVLVFVDIFLFVFQQIRCYSRLLLGR
jgi:hypothetical protein